MLITPFYFNSSNLYDNFLTTEMKKIKSVVCKPRFIFNSRGYFILKRGLSQRIFKYRFNDNRM